MKFIVVIIIKNLLHESIHYNSLQKNQIEIIFATHTINSLKNSNTFFIN